jgi:hypothetical protein
VAGGLGLFQVATGNDASDLMAEMLLAGADAAPQLAADAGDGGGPPVAGGRRLNVYNPLVAVAELFGDQSWQWLPPQLCGLAPESTLPPLTAQPPPSVRAGQLQPGRGCRLAGLLGMGGGGGPLFLEDGLGMITGSTGPAAVPPAAAASAGLTSAWVCP